MFADMLAQAMARGVHEGGGMTWRFALLVLVAVVIAGCPAAAPPRPQDVSTVAKPVAATRAHASTTLPGFRLSNDEGDADDRHGRASAPTTPLSDADTKKIFARLPAMP